MILEDNTDNQEYSNLRCTKELKHFPFDSFGELKKQVMMGAADINVVRHVALQWAQNGIYLPTSLKLQVLFIASLPYATAIGFIVYVIVTKNWYLFIALPILFIGFFVFHPSASVIFGFIRSSLIGLVFVSLAFGLAKGIGWLVAISVSLIVIWYSLQMVYKKSVTGLTNAVLEHEDLLCLLWVNNALNVTMRNGDSYWAKWKVKGGKVINYDTGNTYEL